MTAQELATIADKPVTEKPRRISKKIRLAVNLLSTGECKTIKAAAERANLHPDYLGRELKKPPIRVFFERKCRETLAAGTMRASARLIELLDAGSEHVSFEASKHVLGIAGIKPQADTQVSVNIDIKAGYVIDLSEPGMRDVTPKTSTINGSVRNESVE